MQVFEVFENKRLRRGMTIAELARRVHMEYESLRRVLKGDREIQSLEFLNLCEELELSLEDFSDCLFETEKGNDCFIGNMNPDLCST